VSGEALVLALSSVVRPSTLAAVYAMLSGRGAQRLLIVYLVTGMTFSIVVGAVVVFVLQGSSTGPRSVVGRSVLDIALGAAACGYAAGGWPRQGAGPSVTTSRTAAWMKHRLENLKTPGAALIGVVTHLPGLVYIAALNAIAGASVSTLDALLQVAVYNVIWYCLAIGALVLSVFRPDMARDLLEHAEVALRRHRRVILVAIVGAGFYLIARGLSTLLGR
jgi:Sap, sulfolipid-1-addressing protein